MGKPFPVLFSQPSRTSILTEFGAPSPLSCMEVQAHRKRVMDSMWPSTRIDTAKQWVRTYQPDVIPQHPCC